MNSITTSSDGGLVTYLFFKVHPTHRFAADFDGDNAECVWCACRPYNDEAKLPCPVNGKGWGDEVERERSRNE